MKTKLQIVGEFEVRSKQRECFVNGELWQEWFEKYPEIFDEDDLRLAKSQASKGYHFYEWLAAIQIYLSTGYLSLVEKYQFEKHKRKHKIFIDLVSSRYNDLISCQSQYGNVQFPDLFVYAPDFSEWFFCEVKGPTDRIRKEQSEFFYDLSNILSKQIRLVKFRLLK